MSSISDFFNNLNSAGIQNLSQVFTSLGAGGVNAVVSGFSGPSNNAQAIGKLLSRVAGVYASGNVQALQSMAITAAPLEVGLTSAQVIALSNVWDQANIPGNLAQLDQAIAQAKTALGLGD